MSDEAQARVKAPTLFRNYISFAGALIVAASLASIILLFLIEFTKAADNPHLGIVTYVMLPAVLIAGLIMSAFVSYRAYEYSESLEFCGTTLHSVMKPEYVSFLATSHARIRCVECHVGHGGRVVCALETQRR